MIALLFATAAFAQSADFCPSLFDLSQQLRTCTFNALFVRAADACNAKVDRISAEKSAQLGVVLGVNDAASAEAQAAKLANHAANLDNSEASLQALRDDAARARAQMQDYLANFMHPGKINAKLAARLHKPFLDWLEKWPCYSENHALVTKYIGLMDGKIAQLDRTLGTVSQLASSTGHAIRHVASQPETKGVKATSGQGSGNAAPRTGASSITGVAEDADKRAKAKP